MVVDGYNFAYYNENLNVSRWTSLVLSTVVEIDEGWNYFNVRLLY